MSHLKLVVPSEISQQERLPDRIAHGGDEPPGGDDMEKRVSELENFAAEAVKEFRSIDVRLAKIEALLPTLVTKTEMAEMKASLVQWVAGFAIAVIATVLASSAFIVNVLYRLIP